MKKFVMSLIGGILFACIMVPTLHAISRKDGNTDLTVEDFGEQQIFETLTITSFTAANGNGANNLVSAYSGSRAYLQCTSGNQYRISISSFSVGLVAGAGNTVTL